MHEAFTIARSELVLGGQRSGKSRRAETLARDWLARSSGHRAVLVATAQARDDEMRERIARHQRDRAERVPDLIAIEEPLRLAQAITRHSRADTLVLVDCLTLWLTNCLMPMPVPSPGPDAEAGATPRSFEEIKPSAPAQPEQFAMLLEAIRTAPGPLILVSNEIGLGVIPMGAEVRAFVDALGQLNQAVAQACARVTLMAAGLALTLKAPA